MLYVAYMISRCLLDTKNARLIWSISKQHRNSRINENLRWTECKDDDGMQENVWACKTECKKCSRCKILWWDTRKKCNIKQTNTLKKI